MSLKVQKSFLNLSKIGERGLKDVPEKSRQRCDPSLAISGMWVHIMEIIHDSMRKLSLMRQCQISRFLCKPLFMRSREEDESEEDGRTRKRTQPPLVNIDDSDDDDPNKAEDPKKALEMRLSILLRTRMMMMMMAVRVTISATVNLKRTKKTTLNSKRQLSKTKRVGEHSLPKSNLPTRKERSCLS